VRRATPKAEKIVGTSLHNPYCDTHMLSPASTMSRLQLHVCTAPLSGYVLHGLVQGIRSTVITLTLTSYCSFYSHIPDTSPIAHVT
jgi:hypothetical protein